MTRRRRRIAHLTRITGAALLHLLMLLAAAVWLIHASAAPAAGANNRHRLTVSIDVRPGGGGDVRVEALGACGATCGVSIRWRAKVGGRLIDQGRGLVTYLEVERDVPMLVVAELRDRTGVIGTTWRWFTYDGQVNDLPPPAASPPPEP